MELDLGCCRCKLLTKDDLVIEDGFELPNDEDKGHDILEVTAATDNLVHSHFERDKSNEIAIDLQTVHI